MLIAQRSLVRQAYEMGQEAKAVLGIRVSPFYEQRVLIRGRRIDITPMLDTFFFAGFDGEPYPEQPGDAKSEAAKTDAAKSSNLNEGRSNVAIPAESN